MTGNVNADRPAVGSSESGRSMVCVMGAHSGVGVSTVSANLAFCAQRGKLNRETALLDLNLYEGDLHLLLRLEPEHFWRELMRDPLVLDPTLLMSVLMKHKTGLHLLASDYDGLPEVSVPSDKINRLCSLAQSLFPMIVADCGTVLNSTVTTVLTAATTVLLVTTLEVPAMRRTLAMMEALKALGHGRERVVVVLNRSRREDQGLQAEAEGLIGQPIDFLVPNVPEDAHEALETGRLLCADKKSGAVVKVYERLAARLIDTKREALSRPASWHSRWISRLWGDAA